MDHARKIGKTQKSFPYRKTHSPPSSIFDKPLIGDERVTEDKRLKNWRKWLADWANHCESYKAKTHRDYENLLINTPDKFRRTVYIKNPTECADGASTKKIDKHRGDPGFWLTPEFLPNHGNPDWPDISITLTRKQLNLAPEIEKIALPRLTQEEKGLRLRREKNPPRNRNESVKSRIAQEVSEEEEPNIDELFIKGRRLGRRNSDPPKIPNITIAGAEAFEFPKMLVSTQNNAIVLKVQDRVVEYGNESSDEATNDFTLTFKSSGSTIVERDIRLENRGTCAITYRWRYGSPGTTLIPSTPRRSPFSFNKSKNLILPGQIIVVRVWFRSLVPGTVTEFWTLSTDPKIRLAPLIFRFWGCSSLAASNEDLLDLDAGCRSIEAYLDARIRDTAIEKIIREILEDVQPIELPSPAYKSLFVECEIFRAKNPPYYYHSGAIRELRIIHHNATSSDSLAWSLSLNDLRQVLLKLRNPEARSDAMLRFNELCRDCLAPRLYNENKNFRTAMVYNSLCSFANKFENESEHVRKICEQEEHSLRTSTAAQGYASRSTSVSRMSRSSLTPRGKSSKISRPRLSTRPKTSSGTSIISTPTNGDIAAPISLTRRTKAERRLYKEVFYVRIREMLGNTIGGIAAILETDDNLSGRRK